MESEERQECALIARGETKPSSWVATQRYASGSGSTVTKDETESHDAQTSKD